MAPFAEPAAAWASLVAPATRARWTFLEELFEICESCGGSGSDPYAGACYGCAHHGKHLVGYRAHPDPRSLAEVVLFAADLPVMHAVDAHACELAARLVPWGGAAVTQLEWVHAAPSALEPRAYAPTCLHPVLASLRADAADGSIPHVGSGDDWWFGVATRAWTARRASQPSPFAPLAAIYAAGYYANVTSSAIRVFCTQ